MRRVALWFLAGVLLGLGALGGMMLSARGSAHSRVPEAWRKVDYEVNTLDRRTASRMSAEDSVFDCEDFARTKLQRLLALGVPKDQMKLWVVRRDGWRDRHMVLQVGDFILDNVFWDIPTRQQAEQRYSHWTPAADQNPVEPARIEVPE